jgi:AbiV family abortive infection protein
MQMSPNTARAFWKALMDNATGLIADADALLERESFGRARSLTVLAQEEQGKALWIYETFEPSWSTGAEAPLERPKLKTHGRHHASKYTDAFVLGQDLAAFWGDYDAYDFPIDGSQADWDEHFTKQQREAEAAGKQANAEKMLGFYVDLNDDGESVLSPVDIASGTIAADLRTAAQVIEMLLIKDHSRMKLDATTPYDSTHKQQHRLLPISHPEEWNAASEDFRTKDDWDSPEP